MSLVSIIVPCFNAGNLVEEAVKSSLAQTYSNLEVIVVDDGSTDAQTLSALDRLTTVPRVQLVRQNNLGLPAARNAGIAAAAGRYILPLDADDLIEPTYVAEAVEVLEGRPEVGMVYCRADLFGDVQGPWNLPDFSWSRVLVHNMVFCTSLFRRADWEAAGGYDESMRSGREDHDFVLRILGLGRQVHRLESVLFHYRRHGTTMNDEFGQSRTKLIEASGKLLRNNSPLYVEHAEDLFQFIFDQHDQIMDLRHRYRILEDLRSRYPSAVEVVKTVRNCLRGVPRQLKRKVFHNNARG